MTAKPQRPPQATPRSRTADPSPAEGLGDEVAAALDELARSGEVSELRIPNYRWEFELFARHMSTLHGVQHLRDVSEEQAASFIAYPDITSEHVTPAPWTTQWHRRSNLRLLYRMARSIGLADSDPTLDVKLPPRGTRSTRPLTDDEIVLGRSHSITALRETCTPAAWALAEATATTIECASIIISDLDLATSSVWVHGTLRRVPRTVELTEWGAEQLERRVAFLRSGGAAGDALVLAQRAKGVLTAAGTAQNAIRRALTRAGLSDDPAVQPASVAAWRGAHEFFENKATLDQVAKLLGVRKLDSAANMIGHHWRAARTP